MIIPNRKFGVELEIKGLEPERAAEVLTAAGISTIYEGYNHYVRQHWKVVNDSSLNGIACEVVSPILLGQEGIDVCKKVAKVLSEAGARIDKECGFHVHINAQDLEVKDVVNIAKRYAKFEELIDTMMPQSRRGDHNRFCYSFSKIWNQVQILNWNDITTFANYLSRIPYSSDTVRYNKLNFMSYMRHKTIEFRQHSGTINANKIENWIMFCLCFVETSCLTSGTVVSTRKSKNTEKYDRVIQELRASYRGLTISEICAITGWSPRSVPSYMSFLRKNRNCRIKKVIYTERYKLVNGGLLSTEIVQHNSTSQEEIRRAARRVNTENDTLFTGMPNSVIAFFMERISDLSER